MECKERGMRKERNERRNVKRNENRKKKRNKWRWLRREISNGSQRVDFIVRLPRFKHRQYKCKRESFSAMAGKKAGRVNRYHIKSVKNNTHLWRGLSLVLSSTRLLLLMLFLFSLIVMRWPHFLHVTLRKW
jgi:hypothetical protein